MQFNQILTFIADILKTEGWTGSKALEKFNTSDWQNLEHLCSHDDGSLSEDDQSMLNAFVAAHHDSEQWMDEAKSHTLPRISEMHIDWQLDADCPLTPEEMQRLSFHIAKLKAA